LTAFLVSIVEIVTPFLPGICSTAFVVVVVVTAAIAAGTAIVGVDSDFSMSLLDVVDSLLFDMNRKSVCPYNYDHISLIS
jgi:hypothetical protein